MEQLPIIQSLWIGDRLSTMERLCIASFLHHGHPFHLYTYDHVENVPEGTTIKDANKIVPSDMIFKYTEHNTYAGFSNIFRYKLLYEKGGYWVDTDNVCLKPFISEAEYIFSSERPEKSENDILQVTNNGVIKTPKGSAIMEYCYNEAISKDKNKLKWGDIGPKLTAAAVKKFGLDPYVSAPEEFCTIDWWNWKQFIDENVDKSILSNVYSVHLWNEMWRRNGVDKDSGFDENSIYESLKNVYLKTPKYDEDTPLMVSICVMSYNLEKYIAEALDSILMQKVNFNYDIVIGDDCSTDDTRQILQEYKNKHPDKIELFLRKKNIGILKNFTETLKSCTGKYIAILDGDDYWTDPFKLQKQVDFLERNKEYSMVFHNIELHDETKNGVIVKPFNKENESREYTYDEITKTWSIGTCSVVCVNNKQYEYIEQNPWFPVQDLPFYLCTASRGKLYYMGEIMSVYRRLLTGSISSFSKDPKINDKFIKYFEVLSRDFHTLLSKETIQYVKSSHYLSAANKYNKKGEEQKYKQYVCSAMTENPELIYTRLIQSKKSKIKSLKDKITLQNKRVQTLQNELEQTKEDRQSLLRKIHQLVTTSAKTKPIKKYKAYKSMLNVFYKIKKDK